MVSKFGIKLNQSLGASILALLCVVALVALQMPQLEILKNKAKTSLPEDLQVQVKAEELRLNMLKKIPAFGFDNALADWVFLNFAQYFGDDEARKVTGYQISPDYFEVILDRDPRFLQAYLFLSTSSSLYAAMPGKSVALMEKGLKSISPQFQPTAYYIWRYKGTDELLFLGNPQAAIKSFYKAAEWASLSSNQEGRNLAAVSRQTAEFLSRNPQSKSAQINAWSMILSNPIDQRTKQNVIRRIESLGGKVTVTPSGATEIELPNKD